MKLAIKKLLLTSLSRVGPYCPTGWLQDVLFLRLASYVMDERVLPRRAVPRPLRGIAVMLLCNPYISTHKRLFWFARLEQRAIESYLRRELRAGDTFIDVGSNYGHLTVLASVLVGEAGRVIAFDANEPLANALTTYCESCGLRNVRIHPFGLGNTEVDDDLLVDPRYPGQSFLRDTAREADMDHSQVLHCVIQKGDHMLEVEELPGRVCLKVDVEGYEIQVLKGLAQILAKKVDHAIVEVSPEWIGGADGVEELFSIMRSAGFKAYALRGDGQTLGELKSSDIGRQVDVVFRKEAR